MMCDPVDTMRPPRMWLWIVVALCCAGFVTPLQTMSERKSPVGHPGRPNELEVSSQRREIGDENRMHFKRRTTHGSAFAAAVSRAEIMAAPNTTRRRMCRLSMGPCLRRSKRTTRAYAGLPTGRSTRSANERTNLCDTQECRCTGKQLGLTVQCNYTKSYLILRDDLYIDTTYKILVLNLSPTTTLTVHKGFFHNNQVQRFQINGGQQFELASNAMDGNNKAIFPQIEFLGCGKVIFGSFAFHNEFKLNVTDVRTVYVFPEAFSNTLFLAKFQRVSDLRIQAKAFLGARARCHLHVVDSQVDELAPLQASLREVKFERSRIGVIEALAFDVTEVFSVEFRRCQIGVVRTSAFTEKLYSRMVSFLDSTIETFEPNAISKSGINDFILKNNHINRMNENAIQTTTVNTQIINNTIVHAEELWLSVTDWQTVTVSANFFGTFGRIDLKSSNNPVECGFRHNLIAESIKDCLNFGYSNCNVQNTTFNQHCLCEQSWPRRMFRNGPKDGQLEEVNCLVDETVQTCYNTTHMKAAEFQANICSKTKRYVDCVNDRRTQMDITGFPSLNERKEFVWDLKQIAIIAGSLVLLVVLLSAVVAICRRIRRSSNHVRAGNITCSETILTGSDSSSNVSDHRTTLIMKPSKSFSVDDRVIIRQTLHQMKGRYRPELYDQVYNNTMKVLNNGLNEPEQVAAIGEIIEALRECQKSGGDFVAFTAILYRQLEPQENLVAQTLDPVYAEPGLMTGSGGDMNEHVYAEPGNLQQCPLLTNEYASPLDRDQDNYNEYAEPHRGNDTSRRIISPYAVAATKPSAPTLTTTEPNLPDVLPSTQTNRRPAQLPAYPPHYQTTSNNTPVIPGGAHHQPDQQPPLYSLPMHKNASAKPGTSTASAFASARYARRAKERTPPDDAQTHSDHSGGSDVTCCMDEAIDYADS